MRKLLHYFKLNNMTYIKFMTFIIVAESSFLAYKFKKTASHMSQNNMINHLSLMTAVLVKFKDPDYVHLDTQTKNTSQLIACHGYKTEEHTVISNGYILKMFRIPGDGPSVFIMHGLLSTSDDWLMLGVKSLPIILADLGYDVWLGNARGNTYNRRHIYLSPKNPKFWDFSWDEMGTEDLSAFIDYICKIVGVTRITYVGYSEGTTSVFVLLSEKPEYNEKLFGIVCLSAVSYMSNIQSRVARRVAEFKITVETLFKFFGLYEIAPHRPPYSNFTEICASSELVSTLCITLIYPLVGFDYGQIDYDHIQDQLRHIPSGSSLKQIIHYLQIITSEFFQKYDYGDEGNMEIYGSITPPSYQLENISTNMTIIYGNNDWLSNFEKDVTRMIARLPTPPEIFKVEHECWNHLDYIWGKDADLLVYYDVAKMLKKYNSLSCF